MIGRGIMKCIVVWLYRKFVYDHNQCDEYQRIQLQQMNSRELLNVYSKYITGDIRTRSEFDYLSLRQEVISRLDKSENNYGN